ncbi:MAG: hypothetical protein AABZ39_08140 [Spirochaetota bacterium]
MKAQPNILWICAEHHGMPMGELYDLEHDPGEFENRWDDPSFADVRYDMIRRCFDARIFTMDPLPGRQGPF